MLVGRLSLWDVIDAGGWRTLDFVIFERRDDAITTIIEFQ